MAEVSLRDLRNRGGKILDRVSAGEHVTVTKDGRPMARLEPVTRAPLPAAALIERFAQLPRLNAGRLRADVDGALDQRL